MTERKYNICKDCLHNEVCRDWWSEQEENLFSESNIACRVFADRAEWAHMPCKVGDTLYIISRDEVVPVLVDSIAYYRNSVKISCSNEEYWGYGSVLLNTDKSIVPWFASKEEAEKTLNGGLKENGKRIM